MNNAITLNTGASIPLLGLGTWKSPPGVVGVAVEHAILEAGYRHIDCAAIYENEPEIGVAFKKVFSSGKVKREEVFITSKLWNTAHASGDVVTACKKTLHDLQLDYLDLYLMHWGIAESPHLVSRVIEHVVSGTSPRIPVRETWEALENLVDAGLVKAIGVANFTGLALFDLLTYARIKPAVNQIELHPYNQQSRLVEFCQRQGIVVTAYSPLGTPGTIKGKSDEPVLLQDKIVVAMAERHNKTPGQILIRWAVERNTIVIPKSISPTRLRENISVFDFELSKEDGKALAALERRHRFVDPWEWWQVPYFE
ncbi:MAG: aldo/keto reductase [Candidatus Magasanikbacteria bacterium]|nr:aldo/keto reductase [Candidatus Magasanikbacteria bacterium]